MIPAVGFVIGNVEILSGMTRTKVRCLISGRLKPFVRGGEPGPITDYYIDKGVQIDCDLREESELLAACDPTNVVIFGRKGFNMSVEQCIEWLKNHNLNYVVEESNVFCNDLQIVFSVDGAGRHAEVETVSLFAKTYYTTPMQ